MKKIKDTQREKPSWVKIDGLYSISNIVSNYFEYKNVNMQIIRYNMDKVPFNPRKYIPKNILKNLPKESIVSNDEITIEDELDQEVRQYEMELDEYIKDYY